MTNSKIHQNTAANFLFPNIHFVTVNHFEPVTVIFFPAQFQDSGKIMVRFRFGAGSTPRSQHSYGIESWLGDAI